jgi:hypothetical protein
VLIQCMDWNIATRQKGIPQSDLPDLHQKAVDLLDLLQKNLPDKTGEKGKWNFEKAHSILHKVREIVLWGNSDNTSCQAPEVCTCTYLFMIGMYRYIPSTYRTYSFILMVYLFFQHAHIENIKTVANLTNNKDVFMCILRFHARAGYLQTYESLLKEVNAHPGSAPVDDDQYHVECAALSDRNFNLACETGIRYPSLVAMLNRRSMMWRMSVMYHDMSECTCLYCEEASTSQYVPGIYPDFVGMNRLRHEIVLVLCA